jgi:hypothetical protein
MKTLEINIERTIQNKKFLSLILIAVLMTSLLPLPLLVNFMKDYSRM